VKPQLDRRDAAFLAILLALALPLYAWHLFQPPIYHWDVHVPQAGVPASNFVKFGVLPLGVSGPSLDNYDDYRKHYYVNHPPLPLVILAGLHALGGDITVSYRAMMAVVSALIVIAFLGLSRSLMERKAAWIATALLALMPLFSYFTPRVTHRGMALLFVIVEMLAYRAWRAGGRRAWFVAMIAAQILACLCDWEGYYGAAVIAAYELWTCRSLKLGALLVAVNLMTFAAYLGWTVLLEPERQSVLHQFLNLRSSRAGSPTVLEQAGAEVWEIGKHVTAAVALAGIIGLPLLWRRRGDGVFPFVVCWLAMAGDQILFRAYCVIHDFMLLPTAPFFAWAAAAAMARSRALAAVLLIGFAAQTGWVMRTHLTAHAGADDVRHDLAVLVRDHTEPDERVLVITRRPISHLALYSERYVEVFCPYDQALEQSYAGIPEHPLTLQQLIQKIRTGERLYSTIVVARTDLLTRDHPRFAGDVELAHWWHALDAENPDLKALTELGARIEFHKGFVFIRR
jgi:hypothetical protein